MTGILPHLSYNFYLKQEECATERKCIWKPICLTKLIHELLFSLKTFTKMTQYYYSLTADHKKGNMQSGSYSLDGLSQRRSLIMARIVLTTMNKLSAINAILHPTVIVLLITQLITCTISHPEYVYKGQMYQLTLAINLT